MTEKEYPDISNEPLGFLEFANKYNVDPAKISRNSDLFDLKYSEFKVKPQIIDNQKSRDVLITLNNRKPGRRKKTI